MRNEVGAYLLSIVGCRPGFAFSDIVKLASSAKDHVTATIWDLVLSWLVTRAGRMGEEQLEVDVGGGR